MSRGFERQKGRLAHERRASILQRATMEVTMRAILLALGALGLVAIPAYAAYCIFC
jgi:hypothetical protein